MKSTMRLLLVLLAAWSVPGFARAPGFAHEAGPLVSCDYAHRGGGYRVYISRSAETPERLVAFVREADYEGEYTVARFPIWITAHGETAIVFASPAGDFLLNIDLRRIVTSPDSRWQGYAAKFSARTEKREYWEERLICEAMFPRLR